MRADHADGVASLPFLDSFLLEQVACSRREDFREPTANVKIDRTYLDLLEAGLL
jgi:hypothetical protein